MWTAPSASADSRVFRRCQVGFGHIRTLNPAMERLLRRAEDASRTRHPLLIAGEPGSGKEALAQAIHNACRATTGRFIKVTLGLTMRGLLEAFAAASGGTLYVKEPWKQPLPLQERLAELCELAHSPHDVRLIASCIAMPRGNQTSPDLYRILAHEFQTIPLRERPEDVLPLWDAFIDAEARLLGRPAPGRSEEVSHWLQWQPWLGNLREMCHRAQRVLLWARGAVITMADLAREGPEPVWFGLPAPGVVVPFEEMKQAYFEYALRMCGGNIRGAARALGIGVNRLYRVLARR